MGESSIDELFDGPWGIVAERRAEIEGGPFGVFDRVYEEEIDKHFVSISRAAGMLDCHESTARTCLREADARYIVRGQSYRYFRPDVEKSKAIRAERKASKTTEVEGDSSGGEAA